MRKGKTEGEKEGTEEGRKETRSAEGGRKGRLNSGVEDGQREQGVGGDKGSEILKQKKSPPPPPHTHTLFHTIASTFKFIIKLFYFG